MILKRKSPIFREEKSYKRKRSVFLKGLTLGIETSCDETAASVIKGGRQILSNVVSSSVNFHARYGGIVPEIASRFHVETIDRVTEAALDEAKKDIDDIDLIAVTYSPGLLSSLLVGISFAKALSFGLGIPLVSVDHLKAHLWSVFLEQPVRLPAIGLVVSGGHTSLIHIKDINSFLTLGQTLDDAVGETYDKVAKILGLGYPGGPIIDRLAKKGNPGRFNFPCAQLPHSLDFSFSGIKTAVLYKVQSLKQGFRSGAPRWRVGKRKLTNRLNAQDIADLAASFQKSVVDILVKKTLAACRLRKLKQVLVGGGVAANSSLRRRLSLEAKSQGVKVYFPSKSLCLDNAAMVASLGYQLYQMKPELSERKRN